MHPEARVEGSGLATGPPAAAQVGQGAGETVAAQSS